MSLRDLVEASARCVRCDAPYGQCRCWVQCVCGWMKERGAEGCSRCLSVQWARVAPSTYEARIGEYALRTFRTTPHWTFTITEPDGTVHRGGSLTATNMAAQHYAVARAWEIGAESPPPVLMAASRPSEGGR